MTMECGGLAAPMWNVSPHAIIGSREFHDFISLGGSSVIEMRNFQAMLSQTGHSSSCFVLAKT